MENKTIAIDITEKMNSNEKMFVISGRDFGERQRQELEIDEKIENNDSITIVIPKTIYSISSSFFLGMFGEILRKYGREKFLNKVKFKCENSTVNENINDGIFDALNTAAAV